MTGQSTDVQQDLLAEARQQNKTLKALLFRADLLLLLMLIGVFVSLSGAFR